MMNFDLDLLAGPQQQYAADEVPLLTCSQEEAAEKRRIRKRALLGETKRRGREGARDELGKYFRVIDAPDVESPNMPWSGTFASRQENLPPAPTIDEFMQEFLEFDLVAPGPKQRLDDARSVGLDYGWEDREILRLEALGQKPPTVRFNNHAEFIKMADATHDERFEWALHIMRATPSTEPRAALRYPGSFRDLFVGATINIRNAKKFYRFRNMLLDHHDVTPPDLEYISEANKASFQNIMSRLERGDAAPITPTVAPEIATQAATQAPVQEELLSIF